jgi:hypothetical protein
MCPGRLCPPRPSGDVAAHGAGKGYKPVDQGRTYGVAEELGVI